MSRYCYCSIIQPEKIAAIKAHWTNKPPETETIKNAEIDFWQVLQMTGFESWLQTSHRGNFMIHCLEGASLDGIFKRLQSQIAARNPIALKLRAFYLDVLGKDYSLPEVKPDIECLLDTSLPSPPSKIIKKGFVYPLLPHKEEEHRAFRKESMGKLKARDEASMRAFGVFRITRWLQNTPHGKYLVCYSERTATSTTAAERLAQGKNCSEWLEISKILMDHTGLSYEELSPNAQWLTAKN